MVRKGLGLWLGLGLGLYSCEDLPTLMRICPPGFQGFAHL